MTENAGWNDHLSNHTPSPQKLFCKQAQTLGRQECGRILDRAKPNQFQCPATKPLHPLQPRPAEIVTTKNKSGRIVPHSKVYATVSVESPRPGAFDTAIRLRWIFKLQMGELEAGPP